jgi:hypothetical protein
MKPLMQQFLEGNYSSPGSFEMAMFNLFGVADRINKAKLKKTFPNYFGEPTEEESAWLKSEDFGKASVSPPPFTGFIEKTISYTSMVKFTGRNGEYKQTGLNLELENNVISFQPITSKELIGRCRQQIPLDHVPLVIQALQELQGLSASQSNNNPNQ